MTRGEYPPQNDKEHMLPANTRLLVAIGAAVSLNCQRCLESLLPSAVEHGIEPEEIAEVITLATEARENASGFTLDLVAGLTGPGAAEGSGQACCGTDKTRPTRSPDALEGK